MGNLKSPSSGRDEEIIYSFRHGNSPAEHNGQDPVHRLLTPRQSRCRPLTDTVLGFHSTLPQHIVRSKPF